MRYELGMKTLLLFATILAISSSAAFAGRTETWKRALNCGNYDPIKHDGNSIDNSPYTFVIDQVKDPSGTSRKIYIFKNSSFGSHQVKSGEGCMGRDEILTCELDFMKVQFNVNQLPIYTLYGNFQVPTYKATITIKRTFLSPKVYEGQCQLEI